MNLIEKSLVSTRWPALVLAASLITVVSQADAGSFLNQLKDPEDGWFDASDWVLKNAHGFMPVPIIITEPAVGEGLGVALLFFHHPNGEEGQEQNNKTGSDNEIPELASDGETTADSVPGEAKKFIQPSISAAAAAATNNGTWFAGGGHFARWKDDTVHYDGVAGYASVNLTFYGSPGFPGGNQGLEFNGTGVFIDQKISWRLQDSNFFLGPTYTFLEVDAQFDLGQILPGLPGIGRTARQSGLGAYLSYDSRDSIFTPSNGAEGEIAVTVNDKNIGSDFDYERYDAFLHKYWNPSQPWVVGLRLDGQYVDGNLPFYSVPFIELRGIPAMRYQGRAVAVGEVEVRWDFHPRFSGIGFTGIGVAAEKASDFDQVPSRSTVGLGFRYKVARKLGMYAGIDVARGPEDTYWYLEVGSAWR